MFVCVDQVYRECPVIFIRFKTIIDLVILIIEEYGIILRISWFSSYLDKNDCYAKTITVVVPKMEKSEWEGTF